MNKALAPTAKALHKKGVFFEAEHVPGVENTRADWLSRNVDPKDYRLETKWFNWACQRFRFHPTLDAFANRRNRQLPRYCSWRTDHKSLGNGLLFPWKGERVWCNPPWDIIPKVLSKLSRERGSALFCLPYWPASNWWPDLMEHVTDYEVIYDEKLFHDVMDRPLEPPRWGTIFGVYEASASRTSRSEFVTLKSNTTYRPKQEYGKWKTCSPPSRPLHSG